MLIHATIDQFKLHGILKLPENYPKVEHLR